MSLASKSSRTLSATCATLATSSRSVFRHSQILIKKAIHPSSCTLSRPPSSLRTLSTTSKPPTPPRKPLNRSIPFGAAATLLIGLSTYFYTSEEESILAPDRWTDVTIESVERLTSDTSLFRINVPKSVLPEVLNSDPDAQPILSLFVKEPTLQIQRAYTPLSASCFNPNGSATLELVVKRYANGEISRYLHRLGPGDKISIRAPSVTWYYRPKEWDEVVFIAGGTGVTPAYQLIQDSLTSSSPASPDLSLIYASSSPSNTFLRPSLDKLVESAASSKKNVKIQYQVDRLDPSQSVESLPPNTQVGIIDRKVLEKRIGRKEEGKRRVIVVCGPEGMINAVAGPRGRNFSQGPVGGILKELGYTDREVVKL